MYQAKRDMVYAGREDGESNCVTLEWDVSRFRKDIGDIAVGVYLPVPRLLQTHYPNALQKKRRIEKVVLGGNLV